MVVGPGRYSTRSDRCFSDEGVRVEALGKKIRITLQVGKYTSCVQKRRE